MQLRTGLCWLNHYIHRFGRKETPYCDCGNGKETVEHFFLECRKYAEQRKKLRKDAGTAKMTLERLLGHPQSLKYIEYIKATGM